MWAVRSCQRLARWKPTLVVRGCFISLSSHFSWEMYNVQIPPTKTLPSFMNRKCSFPCGGSAGFWKVRFAIRIASLFQTWRTAETTAACVAGLTPLTRSWSPYTWLTVQETWVSSPTVPQQHSCSHAVRSASANYSLYTTSRNEQLLIGYYI